MFRIFFFFFGHKAYGILASQPGIELPLHTGRGSLKWTTREIPWSLKKKKKKEEFPRLQGFL